MLTCPKCNKDMYPVCGRKDCVCHTRIPVGELPMKDIDLLFGICCLEFGVLYNYLPFNFINST